MPRANEQVGALLQEYADLLLITGSDAVRARAYQKAARAVALPGQRLDHPGLHSDHRVAGRPQARYAERDMNAYSRRWLLIELSGTTTLPSIVI